MRSKAIIVFVLVLFVLIPVVFVGKSSTIFEGADYYDIINTFFSQISIGEVEKAIELLYISNPWISYKTDDVKQLKAKLTNLTDLVGEYQGNELLTEYVVAKRYAYLYYFVAYDRQPIKFVFEFYKPKDKWMIYSFSFDAEVTDEIEQGIKATMFHDLINQKKL